MEVKKAEPQKKQQTSKTSPKRTVQQSGDEIIDRANQTLDTFLDEKKVSKGLKNMFLFKNVSLPLSIVSIVFTFLYNLSAITLAARWLVYTFYCLAFGFAISALCFSLLAACQKEKVLFLPSLVVSLVAIFAIVV